MKTPVMPYSVAHHYHHDFICGAFSRLAKRKNTSVERIKKQIFIKHNQTIVRQFWKIVDKYLPGHNYQYVGCCPHCGSFELCETPPPGAITDG